MSCHALIPAAGMGRRMACNGNKQYLRLGDRPILAHTIALFQRSEWIDAIWVVSPEEEIRMCRDEVIGRYGLTKVKRVIAGGKERQDSVRLGLQGMTANDADMVLIHDGVRPLFDATQIPELIEAATPDGAVTGVPAKDTIKRVEAGQIIDTPDRQSLWQVQTPQVFPYQLIRQAHEQALADGYVGTDDASLVERLGHPVRMLPGHYRNLKITTPEDLRVAEALLKG